MSKKTKDMGISERLLYEIEVRELTAYRVAKMAGLTQSVVNRWMAGRRSISLESAEKIAEALNLRLVAGKTC